MAEKEGNWDNTGFDQLMKTSKDELESLRKQQTDLMVKYCIRALRIYQAAKPEPLKPTEIAYLTKNEFNQVVGDLTQPATFDNIAKLVKEQWEKKPKK
jgi:hypothetical protein